VRLTPEMEAAHTAFVETLGPNAIWKKVQQSDVG
jgi:hypothetical protein